MSKLRSVNTKFWDDSFITELNPTEKLLFLYLITNSLTNLIGIYEISLRKICFDTGINNDIVSKGLERFEKVKKVFYSENYIILPNWLKNQNLNSNMKVAVIREFEQLPMYLKSTILANDLESLPNDFESIRKALETIQDLNRIKVEVEYKNELNWKSNFEVYKNDLRENYNRLISDIEFIEQQEKYFPGVDIKMSIEKACVNFWATEAGWKHKIKERAKEINWKSTLINAIGLNKVYKDKSAQTINGETYYQMLDRVAKGETK